MSGRAKLAAAHVGPTGAMRLALALSLAAAACVGTPTSQPSAPAAAPAIASAPAQTTDVLVVLAKAEATAWLVDPNDGHAIATLPVGTGPHEVAVSPDGTRAVVANYGAKDPGNTLTMLDLRARSVLATIDLAPHARPHGIAYLPDDRVAVTSEATRALLVVDVAAGRVERAIETGQDVSHMVAIAPGGERAFVANIGSGTMTAIDLRAGTKLADVTTGAGAEGIDVTPDGREVWVTNRAADTVAVVDADTLAVTHTLASPSFPIRARVTPSGAHVLVSNAKSGTVTVFDAPAKKLGHTITIEIAAADLDGRLMQQFGDSSVPIGIVVAPDGARAFVAHANADIISVLDLATWTPTPTKLRAGREPDGMAWARVPGKTSG